MFRKFFTKISTLSDSISSTTPDSKPGATENTVNKGNVSEDHKNKSITGENVDNTLGRGLPGASPASPKTITPDEAALSKAAQALARTTNYQIKKYNKDFAESMLKIIFFLFNHTAHVTYEAEKFVELYSFWNDKEFQLPPNVNLSDIDSKFLAIMFDRTLEFAKKSHENRLQQRKRLEKGKRKDKRKDAKKDKLDNEKPTNEESEESEEADTTSTTLFPGAPSLTPSLLSDSVNGTCELAALHLQKRHQMNEYLTSKEHLSSLENELMTANTNIQSIVSTCKSKFEQLEQLKAQNMEKKNELIKLNERKKETMLQTGVIEREQLTGFHQEQMSQLKDVLASPIILPDISIATNLGIGSDQESSPSKEEKNAATEQ